MVFAMRRAFSQVAAMGGGGGDADANAIIAAMTTPPSGARETLIRTLVADLKTDGVWSLLDSLYILAAADEQAARVDWKRPATTATAVNSPTFTADRGFTFNGSTNYLNTNFTPSTQGVNVTASAGSFGVWELNTLAGATTRHGGIGSVTNTQMAVNPRRGTDEYAAAVSCSYANSIGESLDNVGFTVATLASASVTIHKDGGNEGSAAVTVGGLCNVSLFLGGSNTAGALGNARAAQVSCAVAGNITSDALHIQLAVRVGAYMAAVGA